VLGLNRAARRWIFRDIDMPKFTKLISCDRLEDSTVACFLADDGRSYVAEFSHDVCQALLRELQTAAIGQTQELVGRFRGSNRMPTKSGPSGCSCEMPVNEEAMMAADMIGFMESVV
jgi:hypothetical protein